MRDSDFRNDQFFLKILGNTITYTYHFHIRRSLVSSGLNELHQHSKGRGGKMALMAQVLLFVVFISSAVFFVALAFTKHRMETNAKILEEQNLDASGAAISQGMIRREGRGVIRDSQPSLAWYTRLLK
jgi:hypothetical protein